MSEKFNEITEGSFLRVNEEGKAYWGQSEGGGGGSVPKPLTYDYMPEGYPKKTMVTVTVMEEQELAFAAAGSLYFAALQSLLDIVGGQTYTVKWDGTEHECVCHIFNGKVLTLGNLSIIGMGSDTGEPFCYTSAEGGFMALDTSASHTISVKTTEEIVTPMAAEFLPSEINELIMNSSTTGSTKKFKITVDDSGTLKATEIQFVFN